jgi:hypothetical protein
MSISSKHLRIWKPVGYIVRDKSDRRRALPWRIQARKPENCSTSEGREACMLLEPSLRCWWPGGGACRNRLQWHVQATRCASAVPISSDSVAGTHSSKIRHFQHDFAQDPPPS